MSKPLVAIVGRPNVGKSTLFNRLAGERLAVVDDTPGTTRDRLVAEAEWNGRVFDMVDTGGIEPLPKGRGGAALAEGSAQFVPQMRAQAEMAIAEADAVVFMTEARLGVTEADREVAEILRRRQQRDPATGQPTPPVLLVVNKTEGARHEVEAYAFYELGMGDPLAISALHGTGVAEVLDTLVAALPAAAAPEAENAVKIAIVGRPNVGKSSLLNRLLGEERAIVSPVPGTTRDAIDTPLTFDGQPVILIDTAGVRRRGSIDPGVEKWSVLRTFKAIARCDVALLVLDATDPFSAQDAHIAGFVLDELKSVVVVINKWDAVEKDSHTLDELTARIRTNLHFLDYVPFLFISAKSGQRCGQVLPLALEVQAQRQARISTARLNQLVREAVMRHAPPTHAGRQLKIGYASQVRTDPPTFLFHVNDPELAHFTYRRYLENCLREAFPFTGTPLRLSFRKKSDRD
ncbi:MAG: ribosome biogenesis GTPase Der [Anaerolineales bacterium]|nr:ribosome biogenesis GTPase Der [Anaerolineales bacterium]